jgi:hypothetical protein
VVEINRYASAKISRDLYYAHTDLVVISEELAKEEGITTIFDAIKKQLKTKNNINLKNGFFLAADCRQTHFQIYNPLIVC